MPTGKKMKCKDCGGKLVALNPPCEEYLDHKLCLKLFGFKLMLIKDVIEYGCAYCLKDETDHRLQDSYDNYAQGVIEKEIEKGNLIINES